MGEIVSETWVRLSHSNYNMDWFQVIRYDQVSELDEWFLEWIDDLRKDGIGVMRWWHKMTILRCSRTESYIHPISVDDNASVSVEDTT